MSQDVFERISAQAADRLMLKRSVVVMLVTSLAANLCLAAYLLTKTDETRTVVISPESTEVYVAMSDSVSPNLLERFAVSGLNLVMNVTPQTVAFQAENFLKHVAPESYSQVASLLRMGASELQRTQASAAFFPYAAKVDTQTKTVCLTGERKTLIGKAVTQTKSVNACLTCEVRMGRLWIKRLTMTDAAADVPTPQSNE